ncbi:guanine nucleotide exchange factor 9 [Pseudocyphellaria aurata]|nr:guanine nucleotide exchange factor 9 [Pseudocyphellaria aurata]
MDLATKLFSLSFGVEPNKATLKDFSDILNSAVLSLSEKQKALSDYAETAQTQTYVAAANQSSSQPVQVPKRPAKPQVRWQITEEKMKELLWRRAQLLQFERARAAREKTSQINGKPKPRGPPPKLGKPKSALEKSTQGQANGVKPKTPQAKTSPKPLPSKTSPAQAPKAPDTPKPKSAANQTAKPKPKPAPINTKQQPQAQAQPGKAVNRKSAAKSK